MIFPPHVQKFISTYQILGVVPLDKTLHFLVGAVVTIVGLKLKLSFAKTMLILLVLAVIKETIDLNTLTNTSLEVTLDVLVTFLYPGILFVVRMLKEKKS